MNTYSWNIQSLEVKPVESGFENVVKEVIAMLVADDGLGHTASQLLRVPIGNLDPDNFTAFSSLTPATVSGWVETAMGSTDLATQKAGLDAMIADIVDTPQMAPPWL